MVTPRPWIVLPHEPLEKLEENLWCVQGDLPRSPQMKRRAEFIKLSDGRIVAHPGLCLREEMLRELEAWGELAFCIVPSSFHRLDAHAFRERFPKLKFVAPAACRAKVESVVKLDGDLSLLPKDPALEVLTAAGWKDGEGILRVTSGPRVSLLFSDVIMNLTRLRGFEGFVLGLLGSTGGAKVTRIARLLQVRDQPALKAQLLVLAGTPGLARLVPCHGEIVSEDAAGVLRRAAEQL